MRKKGLLTCVALSIIGIFGFSVSSYASEFYFEEADPAVQLESMDPWQVSFTPIRNTTQTELCLDNISEIQGNELADAVTVEATMSYEGLVTRHVEKELLLSEFSDAGSALLDLADYGKWSVDVSFTKDGDIVEQVTDLVAGTVADSYNISPVSATLPVTFFSLNLWGENNIRESGPVILLMERPGAYDWDQLPDGVYGLPYFTKEDIAYQPGDFTAASDQFRERGPAMAAYVRDLLELDPTSFIHLYCVDFYADLVQSIIYANGIPEEQYAITLLSDGSYTYSKFSSMYNGASPANQHESLANAWLSAKEHAYANGSTDSGFGPGQCGNYLWALVDTEPNAELWVARKDLLSTNNDDNVFGKSVQADPKVVQVNIGSLLAQNIQGSEQNVAEFKALYNFNDSFFEEAENQNKDAMVFLGTRANAEPNFEAYARFVMTYYKDAYVYYYKGHPATPTDLYPQKAEQLDRMGIIDVDASIAAELILFFNPEIYLSGYTSSTYASVPVGMGKGMFNMTKEKGLANPLYANMEFWISPFPKDAGEELQKLYIEGHECYLVEFSDHVMAEEEYDIAVWDVSVPEIRYYRQEEDGSYVLIGSDTEQKTEQVLPEGVYVIGSSLKSNMVLDVASASKVNKGNVQLYQFNGTGAQKWRLTYDDNNRAVLTNVGSGLVLDAAGASVANRTNIWQYSSNATLAQRWILSKNSDGTFTIASALDGKAVVDVDGARAANHTNIQLFGGNGTKAQRFNFYPTDITVPVNGQAELEEGYYTIASAVNTDLVLQAANWAPGNGGNMNVGRNAARENQIFKVTRSKEGYYFFTNAWSDKYLNLDKGSVIPGTNVHQWDANSVNSQWAVYQHSGGSYTIRNVASGLLLDLAGAKNAAETNVQGYTANGTQAQRWLIKKAESPAENRKALAKANRSVLSDGTYGIFSASNFTFAVDVTSASKKNGANVQLYRTNGTAAQRWTVSHDSDGFVTFTNTGSGKVLDVSAAAKRNSTNVIQYQSNNTMAQKWIVTRESDGSYKIISALSEHLVLDLSAASTRNGANIQVYEDNGTKAQRWHVQRIRY